MKEKDMRAKQGHKARGISQHFLSEGLITFAETVPSMPLFEKSKDPLPLNCTFFSCDSYTAAIKDSGEAIMQGIKAHQKENGNKLSLVFAFTDDTVRSTFEKALTGKCASRKLTP